MAADYKIDWAPPDFGPGVSLLLNSIRGREASERADRNAATQEEFARRNLEREEHRDYYERKKFEQGENAIREEAFKSARLLWQQGDKDSAISLLKRHGIESIPEMGQPTTQPAQVLTAADAIQNIDAQRAQQTPAGMPGAAYGAGEAAPTAQPLTALSVMQGMHAGTTVPEEQAAAPEPQPQVLPGAGHAAEDLMPFTVEPEKAIPASPTGAFTFKGPEGQDFGRFDPAAERKFREEKAGRVSSALGPMGQQVQMIGQLIASGDIDQKEGAALMAAIRAENTAAAKVTDREDKQTFTAEENAKYRRPPLTFEQRKELANIMARAKMASAGAGPVPAGVATLIGMKESGATDEDIYAKANELHLSEKQFTQPVQNVVKNAALGERAGEKRAGLEVTDENNHVLGTAHNQQQANTLKKQIDQFAQARVRLRELIEDIKSTGPRALTPDEIQNRLSKAQSVAAAMRVYNGLGATDASQKLESDIMGAIGAPGHGWLMGANLGVVERVLHEAEMQHQTRLNTSLRHGGGHALAPALGGPRQGEDMVTITNQRTGETKRVTREEAQRMGAQ